MTLSDGVVGIRSGITSTDTSALMRNNGLIMGNVDRIKLVMGDITKMDVDAIVNSANPGLLKGGGVCGAIYSAAGPHLISETQALGGCETGEAKITGGYNLKSRFIIHTVGPVYKGGKSGEPALLSSCYRRCLELASLHGCRSITFPSISTGVYGYPIKDAATIALRTTIEGLGQFPSVSLVYFVLFSSGDLRWYSDSLDEFTYEKDPWGRFDRIVELLRPNFEAMRSDGDVDHCLARIPEILSGAKSPEALKEMDYLVSTLRSANDSVLKRRCLETVQLLDDRVKALNKLLDDKKATTSIRNEVLHPFAWDLKRQIQNETVISKFYEMEQDIEEEYENALLVIEDS